MFDINAHYAVVAKWADFLEKKGHKVRKAPGLHYTLESKDRKGNRYLWMITVASGVTRTFRQEELSNIDMLSRRALKRGAEPYVVTEFHKPTPKLIIVPAQQILRRGRISSKKGGIPWD